jgi:hypothetical protein
MAGNFTGRAKMKIPVLINNRDLLDSVRKQVEFFLTISNAHIMLADNASTFPPLLDWYATSCPITIHHLGGNCGPRGAQRLLAELDFDYSYFFMVDPDLDFDGVPADFLESLKDGLDKYPSAQGAGVSLRVDDLPDTPDANRGRETEARYHRKTLDDQFFEADCDTAGVLRRRNWTGGYEGIRNRTAVVRHLPWYHTDEDRPDDFRWFLRHCNPQGTYYTAIVKARNSYG